MTEVRVHLTVPGEDGRVPTGGVLQWKPTRRRVVDRTPGDTDELVLPKPFRLVVGPDGHATIHPDATTDVWAWEVSVSVVGVQDYTEWVRVPDAGPVDFTDLVRVDPATLAPTADPEPAWWAMARSAVTAGTVDRDGHLILNRTDGTTADAGTVVGPQGPAGEPALPFVTGITDSNLRRLHARDGLARALAAQLIAAFIGESTTAGAWTANPGVNAWPQVLGQAIVRSGVIKTGTGPSPAYTNTQDPRWTVGAGWSPFSGQSNFMLATGPGGALVFADPTPGTEVRVAYSDFGAASFAVTVDGGAPVTVTTTGTNSAKEYVINGLPDTAHTVSIRWVSGNVFIWGGEVLEASVGLRVINAAISGAKLADFSATDFWAVPQVILDTWHPHVVFIQMGINDAAAGTPTATWKAQYQTLITRIRGAGADVVLVVSPNAEGMEPVLADYRQAVLDLGRTNSLPVMDMPAVFGPYTEANANGLMGDGWHGNAGLHAAQGAKIAKALGY